MNRILIAVVGAALLLNLAATGQAAEARIQLTALPATMRATPTGPLAGTSAVEIAGARGETESFQVVVTGVDEKLEGVTASLDPLRQAGGPSLPETSLELFRVAWVPVRHSSPRATVAPGLIADALIPFKDPYTGDPVREPRWSDAKPDGPRFGATGFALWPEHHQALWVDVRIPRDATPGVYESALRVTAKNASAVKIPVRLTVWNFTLPEGPTHENHFGGFGRLRAYHRLENDPEKYIRLEERYIAMLAAHRLNPPLPAWLWPEPAADGTVIFDTAADQKFSEFVARYQVTDFPGPRGYPLRRFIRSHGCECLIVAPSKIPRAPGDRVKTDRRDAAPLARLFRAGELTGIYAPDPQDEAVRDLIRARYQVQRQQHRARQQRKMFLLRQNIRYARIKPWTQKHRHYLATVKLPYPEQPWGFQELVHGITEAGERLERDEQQIGRVGEGWRWQPGVKALMSRRGVAELTGATLVAELGDLHRFESAPALMSYLGLCPSEHTRGTTRKQGGITKLGHGMARKTMIEAAWNNSRAPRMSRTVLARQAGLPKAVTEAAWNAQTRLHSRYKHLTGVGKKKSQVGGGGVGAGTGGVRGGDWKDGPTARADA